MGNSNSRLEVASLAAGRLQVLHTGVDMLVYVHYFSSAGAIVSRDEHTQIAAASMIGQHC